MYFNPKTELDFSDMVKTMEGKAKFVAHVKKAMEIFPTAIKEASAGKVRLEDLSNGKFAMVVRQNKNVYRKFPINDSENTWFSQQAFMMNHDNIPLYSKAKTANCIKKACEYFDLEVSDFVSSCSKYAFEEGNFLDLDDESVKIAIDEFKYKTDLNSDFALPSEGKFTLNTDVEVKMARDYFSRNHKALRKDGKAHEFAENLKIAFIKHKMPIVDLVDQYTDDFVRPDTSLLKEGFESRMRLLPQYSFSKKDREIIKQSYDMIAEQAPYLLATEVEDLIKEADGKFFKIHTYNKIASPSVLVDVARTSGKTAMEDIYEMGDDDSESSGKPYQQHVEDREVSKEERALFAKKLEDNSNLIKGRFNEETEQDLFNDFELAFSRMEQLDKDIINDIIQRNI